MVFLSTVENDPSRKDPVLVQLPVVRWFTIISEHFYLLFFAIV